MIIKNVDAKIIKDSRNCETIAVSVNSCEGASSPNGKSTGEYETPSYYKSLRFCVDFLNKFNSEIEINKFDDLIKLEKEICKKLKLKNAKQFGANSLYAFESAVLKALAHDNKKELFEIVNLKAKKIPFPVGNVIGGGLHSSAISKHPDFQEFLVIPKSEDIFKNIQAMKFIYDSIKKELKVLKVNDEGALLVDLDNEQVLTVLNKNIKEAEKRFGFDISVGIDFASSAFFKNGKYNYSIGNVDSTEQHKIMLYLIDKYDLFYLEDPFEEHDFKSFAKLKKNPKCLIVGDDLTATQYNRVVGAIRTKSINAMIIKPNQNGSLLELKRIFDLCRKKGIATVLSHRSGETLDDALADYAVGFGADYIKCGVATKWREVKLDRLVEIEKII
ncbi:MAG: hypothetical protein AABW89_03985 [Nanoarchaeota archaeon]